MNTSSIVGDIQKVLGKYIDISPEDFIPSIRQMILELGEVNVNGTNYHSLDTREIFLNGTRCLRVHPKDAGSDTILYLHGGGYVAGSPESHTHLISALAKHTNRTVIAADYTLAPEAKASAILNELQDLFDVVSNTSRGKTYVMGDSAGGGLALSLSLAQKSENKKIPDAIVTFSAVTDLTLSGNSIKSKQEADPMLQMELLAAVYGIFLSGEFNSNDAIFSPLHGDLAGLPPIYMQVGSNEILLDDTRSFAKRARNAGVKAKDDVWPDMFHVWQNFPTRLPEASQALSKVGDFLDGL